MNQLFIKAETFLRDIPSRDFWARFRHYAARADHGDLVKHVATFYHRKAFSNV